MKVMERVRELVVPSLGMLLVLSLCSATPKAVGSVGGPIMQFKLSDGDNVTCIPIEEQPSLNASIPYKKNPTAEVSPGNSTANAHGAKFANQTFLLDVPGGCPSGTIPVRADRSRGLNTSTSSLTRDDAGVSISEPQLVNGASSSDPGMVTTGGSSQELVLAGFKGAEAFINFWQPVLGSMDESSSAVLTLSKTVHVLGNPPEVTQGIGVGYSASPVYYGDGLPRLALSRTVNDAPDCTDLSCLGFVQVSNKVLLGGSFTPVSKDSGQQYEVKLLVFWDNVTGDWWLQLNDENVGYFPKDVFIVGPLDVGFFDINWFGTVVNDEAANKPTEMGSGKRAGAGYRHAAYQRNLQYVDNNNALVDVPFNALSFENTTCYTVAQGKDFVDWGAYIFFGGTGSSPACDSQS